MIIPFLPQTTFNFSYLANGASEDVVIGDNLPAFIAQWLNISGRLHRVNIGASASYQILVFGSNPSGTDPTKFVTSATIGSTATITSGTPNLVGLSTPIVEPVHPFVTVVLRATGPSAGTANLMLVLSADLVVRSPVAWATATADLAERGEQTQHSVSAKPQRSCITPKDGTGGLVCCNWDGGSIKGNCVCLGAGGCGLLAKYCAKDGGSLHCLEGGVCGCGAPKVS